MCPVTQDSKQKERNGTFAVQGPKLWNSRPTRLQTVTELTDLVKNVFIQTDILYPLNGLLLVGFVCLF